MQLIINIKAFHYSEIIGKGGKRDMSFYSIDIKKEDL